jgi:hypothetical protein
MICICISPCVSYFDAVCFILCVCFTSMHLCKKKKKKKKSSFMVENSRLGSKHLLSPTGFVTVMGRALPQSLQGTGQGGVQ